MSFAEIEGPYSFKGADGLKTPVYIFLPGGERYDIGEATVKVDGGMTFDIQLNEGHENAEYGAFDVPMRFSGHNRKSEPPVEWGFNCLTMGVHHGRPEPLWKLSLVQAVHMFRKEDLQDLVVYRIYTDALIIVHRGHEPRPSEEWAKKTKEIAEELYSDVLRRKIGEISQYYRSPEFKRDVEGVVARVKDNRLNPNYQPLHGHDSINMLCRIIGVSAAGKASKEMPGNLR